MLIKIEAFSEEGKLVGTTSKKFDFSKEIDKNDCHRLLDRFLEAFAEENGK